MMRIEMKLGEDKRDNLVLYTTFVVGKYFS